MSYNLLKGKKGLIFGALNEQSIAWKVAERAVEEGADEDSEDYGLVILKTIEENGEELLSTLDSDEELNTVYDLFMERLFEDEE